MTEEKGKEIQFIWFLPSAEYFSSWWETFFSYFYQYQLRHRKLILIFLTNPFLQELPVKHNFLSLSLFLIPKSLTFHPRAQQSIVNVVIPSLLCKRLPLRSSQSQKKSIRDTEAVQWCCSCR